MSSKNKKIIHLFHWPSIPEYQKKLLQIIALPIGTKGQIYYKNRWVNNTFLKEIDTINNNGDFDAILWVLSCTQDPQNKGINKFNFACPIRLLKILNTELIDEYYYINFIAQEFISTLEIFDNEDNLQNYMQIAFDGQELPCPGVERGYAYVCPSISINTTRTIPLEPLYKVLENIQPSLKYKEEIKEYPLVRIGELPNSKILKNGFYELLIDQKYKIDFSYYQGDSYRNRDIFFNGNRFTGKSLSSSFIGGISKGINELNIEIRCDNLVFNIPLNVAVKVPWYKNWLMPFISMFILSALAVFVFTKLLFPNATTEVKSAIIIPLLVICMDALREVLTKRD